MFVVYICIIQNVENPQDEKVTVPTKVEAPGDETKEIEEQVETQTEVDFSFYLLIGNIYQSCCNFKLPSFCNLIIDFISDLQSRIPIKVVQTFTFCMTIWMLVDMVLDWLSCYKFYQMCQVTNCQHHQISSQ